MDAILQTIQQYERDYRPLPLWSWNARLDAQTLREQMHEMQKQGLGGFFMHARGGLETEYMSEDWLSCVSVCIEEAKRLGLQAWCYDENGWPSGFADGKVPALGEAHHIKWLECKTDVTKQDKVLATQTVDGQTRSIVLCSNPYYVDTLSKDTLSEFIRLTHEQYYARFAESFGETMPGFFTDEPQYKLRSMPWSLDLPESFETAYGYSILPHLFSLFFDLEGCEKVRNDYWTLVARRFREATGWLIGDWCAAHGVRLTGHVMLEDNLTTQMEATAGAMGYYASMQQPGIDWLTRSISSPIIPKQLGSACAQLDRPKALSEMFALCGWDVSFWELKWVAEWQFVNGVNLICPHLEGYTLRGFRKRDYPASLFVQEPWWEKYHLFNRYFSRLGALLGRGKDPASLLLLHPMNSMYVAYTTTPNPKTEALDRAFLEAVEGLSGLQIGYHFGDESLMAEHGAVEGDTLRVGACRYRTVVLPYLLNMTKPVFKLLRTFSENGGALFALQPVRPLLDGERSAELDAFMATVPLVTLSELSERMRDVNRITFTEADKPCTDIHVTARVFPDGAKLWFAVNLNRDASHTVTLRLPKVGDYRLIDLNDLSSASLCKQSDRTTLTFLPAQSYLIAEGDAETDTRPVRLISLPERLEISACTENALTLDRCAYRVQGGEWQPEIPVIRLQSLLTEQRADCFVEMKFRFTVDADEKTRRGMQLVLECPDACTITLNGAPIENTTVGSFVDSAFCRIDLGGFVQNGCNELIIGRRFFQRQKVYDVLFGENVLETERNKLTYDTELESVYIIGDFGVFSQSAYQPLERGALKTEGPFVIRNRPDTVCCRSLTEQGFAYFAGTIDLCFTVEHNKERDVRYLLQDEKMHAVVAEVLVNGKSCGDLLFRPFACDLTDALKSGENRICVRLYSGNRNLLGPHHHPDGECYAVSPNSFLYDAQYQEKTVCLVKFGLNA